MRRRPAARAGRRASPTSRRRRCARSSTARRAIPVAPRQSAPALLYSVIPPVHGSPMTCAPGTWTNTPTLGVHVRQRRHRRGPAERPVGAVRARGAHRGAPIACVVTAGERRRHVDRAHRHDRRGPARRDPAERRAALGPLPQAPLHGQARRGRSELAGRAARARDRRAAGARPVREGPQAPRVHQDARQALRGQARQGHELPREVTAAGAREDDDPGPRGRCGRQPAAARPEEARARALAARPPPRRTVNESDAGESRLRSPPVQRLAAPDLLGGGPLTSVASLLRLVLRVWGKPMRAPPEPRKGAARAIPHPPGKGAVKPRCHTGRQMTMDRSRTQWLPPTAYEPAPAPAPAPAPPPKPQRTGWRRFGTPIFFGLLALLKWGKALLLLLPKAKLLTTSGSMLVSVGAYALIWGWRFAVGFVALLFIHEMGHYIQLRREGVKPSGMVFIPFLGAAVGDALAGRQRAGRGARGARRPDPRLARDRGAAADRGGDRRRLLARARVHRLLPQPVQPAAGRAARRRPRDGGDGAVDVVRRLRRDARAAVHLAEPDPAHHRAARRLRDLPALEAAQARRGGQRRVLPRQAAAPRCSSPPSTSA